MDFMDVHPNDFSNKSYLYRIQDNIHWPIILPINYCTTFTLSYLIIRGCSLIFTYDESCHEDTGSGSTHAYPDEDKNDVVRGPR